MRLLAWLAARIPAQLRSSKQTAGARAALDVPAAAVPAGRRTTGPARTTHSAPASASAAVRRRRHCVSRAAARGPHQRRHVIRAITQTLLPKGDRITIELERRGRVTAASASTIPDRVFFDFAERRARRDRVAERGRDDRRARSSRSVRRRRRHASGVDARRARAGRRAALQRVPALRPVPARHRRRSGRAPARRLGAQRSTPCRTAAIAAAKRASSAHRSTTGRRHDRRRPISAARAAQRRRRRPHRRPPRRRARAAATTRSRGSSASASRASSSTRATAATTPARRSNGVTEAELVLDVALRLEKLLAQQPGVRSRADAPHERVHSARGAHGDRQSRRRRSVPVDSRERAAAQPAVRGIETYFLNFATNPEAEAVAARENAVERADDGHAAGDRQGDRAQQQARGIARARDAACRRRWCGGCRRRARASRDLGVKQAPFVVLIGAADAERAGRDRVPDQQGRGVACSSSRRTGSTIAQALARRDRADIRRR